MKGSCHVAGLMRTHMIGTRTKRDHNSNQSIQRPAPRKVNTNERHGYLLLSWNQFYVTGSNLKVDNEILKSVIAKHFMFCSTWRKNKPARNARSLEWTSFTYTPRSSAHHITNQSDHSLHYNPWSSYSPTTQSNTSFPVYSVILLTLINFFMF